MNKLKELVRAVSLMRDAQRLYFRTRSPFNLKNAKKYTTKVDKLLIEVKKQMELPKKETQQKLF